MNHNHAIIWIDHHKAHIMSFNKEEWDEKLVRAQLHAPHLHAKAGASGSGHAHEDTAYFDEAAKILSGVKELLVVGPGVEKTVFTKYVAKSHPDVAARIVGIETVDHPSTLQLLAYARKYFLKADLYH